MRKRKVKCKECGDYILPPLIYAHLFYGKRYVYLDYGCAERLFEVGLLKLGKGRPNERYNFRTKSHE